MAQPLAQTPFELRADSLLHLAKAMIAKGKAEEGLLLTQEMEGEIVATLGKSSWLRIRALVNYGNYFEGKFQFDQAIEKWKEAVALMDTLYHGDYPLYNRVLGSIGSSYNNMGQTKKAEDVLLIAKHNILSASEQNRNDLIMIDSYLGFVYIASVETEKAERVFLEAREICNKPNCTETMNCMSIDRGLATVYLQTGRFEQSAKIYNSLYKQMIEMGMGDSGLFAALLINMGIVHQNLGDHDKALEFYLKAKDLWDKLAGKNNVYYLTCVQNIGAIYATKKETALAIQFFEETAPILEPIAGTNSRENYTLNFNLGLAYSDLGDYVRAQKRLEEATRIADNIFGQNHENYADVANSLAWNSYHLGHENEAVQMMEKSCKASTSNLARSVTFLTEEELGQYISNIKSHLFDPFRLAHNYSSNGLAAKIAYNYVLFLKGYLMGSVIKTRKLAQSSEKTNQLFAMYQEKSKLLAEQLSLPRSERTGQAELEDTIYHLQKEMILKLEVLEFDDQQIDWESIQKNLPTESVAIEIIDYIDFLERKEADQNHYYSALVLRSDAKSPVLIKLCTQTQLDSIINKQDDRRTEYVNRLYSHPERSLVTIGGSQVTLYDLIIKPLEQTLDGIKTIYYSPSGLLYRINLDAIPISDVETFADKYQVNQLISTRQIASPIEVKVADSTAVLYGGINFDRPVGLSDGQPLTAFHTKGELTFSSVDLTLRGGNWNYLAGTEREVNAISKIVQSASIEPVLFSGSEATEESFKRLGLSGRPSPRVLHMATHGYFFPDPDSKSVEVNEGGEQLFKLSDHPMLRSGLIMAGGNAVWKGEQPLEGRDDGILTAYEISQMNFANTELVVLSACETGLGDIQDNEGVYGLQRAFKIAGAKYLIMSLWQVPDKQTSLLMTTFYKKWLELKMSIPDAFHAAQKELREIGLDPYQWAGFVLVE